jgi:AAA domain
MGPALARVQAKHAAWTRAQLCGELAEVLPPSMAELPPRAAMALALEMADRIIAGEVQPVDCLDAPDPAGGHVPADLWRELDGRSVFVRPGRARYATEVQLSRERRMLAQARAEGALRLSRAKVARLLDADPGALDAQLRESVRAEESRAIQSSGLSAAQQAAAYHVLTSPRRAEIIEAPAGAGKTHVLAAAAAIAHQAGVPAYGLGPTQQAVHVLQAAAAEAGVDLPAWNTAQFLGQRRDGTYREPQPVERAGSCWWTKAPWSVASTPCGSWTTRRGRACG